MIKLDTGSLI